MKRLAGSILLLLLLVLFPGAQEAQGASASLFFSPASGTFSVGASFNIAIKVNSGGGVGINASDGVIKFDPAYLSITGVSDSGSIFKLWTTDPTFSNTSGTASFGGGSPGAYTGSAGTIFSISFKAKKEGNTSVSFSSGNVLAADGKGTNVLSGMAKADFSIGEAKVEETKKEKPKKKEKQEEKPKGLLPPIPEINSASHPDIDIWYANNTPEFSWKILADLTGVSFAITDDPDSNPGQANEGIVESEKFDVQEDGEKYFHIKYQNQYGWGQIAHRKLMIDASPPESFIVTVDSGGDSSNPSPKLIFDARDKTSGVDYYRIIAGDTNLKLETGEVTDGFYKIGPLAPGEYLSSVVAYDKAGNSASSSVVFTIDALKAPIITSIPKSISKKDDLVIEGTSFYPNVFIKIYIGQDNKDAIEGDAKTDEMGNWSYLYKKGLSKGSYNVWAKIIDDRGAQSLESTKHLLFVVSPSLVCAYGFWIILLLVFIAIALLLYLLYQRKVFIAEKMRIRRETQELKVKMSKIFYALREEVDELIELADKKAGLSESERRVKEKLQESLDISEEFISKEIEDVEKEIKLPDKDKQK